MGLKKIILFLIPALLLLGILPAEAEDEPAYDGYLLCLMERNTALFSRLPDSVQAVAPEIGLYHVETLEDAAYFSPEDIRYIEPNYLVYLLEDGETDGGAWNLSMLGADTAWLAGLDGSGVRIGVLDSGLYAEHEALAGTKIVQGYNYVGQDGDTSDTVGHGTFVTGILTMVAPGVEVVPIKCFDGKNGSIDNIIAAIRGAVDDYDCDILNMSFGMASNSVFLREAVEYAAEKGVIMTAAVGNSGTTVKNYPAAYESVIGVGMVGSDKIVSGSSQRNNSVLLTAPGAEVRGLGIESPSAYRTGSGTSYACPHVSAAAALLLEAAPGMMAEEIRTALLQGAEDLGEEGYDTAYGYGLLSVTAMLEALPLNPVQLGGELRLLAVRTGADSLTRVWAASYNDRGRMLDCRMLTVALSDGVLAVNSSIPLVDGVARVKLFFLRNGSMDPMLEPREGILQTIK